MVENERTAEEKGGKEKRLKSCFTSEKSNSYVRHHEVQLPCSGSEGCVRVTTWAWAPDPGIFNSEPAYPTSFRPCTEIKAT